MYGKYLFPTYLHLQLRSHTFPITEPMVLLEVNGGLLLWPACKFMILFMHANHILYIYGFFSQANAIMKGGFWNALNHLRCLLGEHYICYNILIYFSLYLCEWIFYTRVKGYSMNMTPLSVYILILSFI